MLRLRHSLLAGARASQRTITNARCASTLVIADHDNKSVSESLLQVVAAANKFGNPVTVLVAGKGCGAAGEAAAKLGLQGVSKVIVADSDALAHPVAEQVSGLVSDLQATNKFTHIVASANPFNKNWVPRFAVGVDTQPLSDVISIVSPDTFVRPTYAGNAIATLKSKDPIKIVTVRASSFEKASTGGSAAAVESFSAPSLANPVGGSAKWESESVVKSERPELSSAKVVIAGGRGLKNGENFGMLNELADLFGGAVGASRAAVDAGYVPNDLQVGQTGKIVAPDLYVAVGISGAIQHLAGMKDSKTIVAINKDAEAPIFQVADYGLVDDLFTAVPEFTKKVKAAKGK